jgi:hypothetical protein
VRLLHRPAVVLPTLTGEGKGAKEADRHQRTKASAPAEELKFPEHWNEADVRGALYAMHGWVCVYCQCELPRNDRGDVEHFRPKNGGQGASHDGYWWLAYVFDNYLLSCSRCNRTIKSNLFPIAPGTAHITYATRIAIASEARLLLDPVADPVEDWLEVDCKDELCSVQERDACIKDATGHARGTETVQFFRLNRDIQLVRERVQARDRAQDLYREGKLDALRRSASRYRPHGLTVRAFLDDFTTGVSLPSREEEIFWLLEEIDELLRLEAKCLARNRYDATCEKQVHELWWTLAVLWKAPPQGCSAAMIEQWLKAKSWKAPVEGLFLKLK